MKLSACVRGGERRGKGSGMHLDGDLPCLLDESPAPTPAPMPMARMRTMRTIISQKMRGFTPSTRT